MKKCKKCDVEYPLPYNNYFYKAANNRDGFKGSCKICWKKACNSYAEKNAESIRNKKREQYNNPDIEDYRKRYLKTDLGRLNMMASQKRWRERNPDRYRLYSKVKWAIKKGTIEQKPCGMCGNKKASFYHYDSELPLFVYWRCHPCKKTYSKRNSVEEYCSKTITPIQQLNYQSS